MMDGQDVYPRLEQCKGIKGGKYRIESELSSLQKRISDLQRQRKLAYRNSAKAKKTIHNQINQIVKCLRARERYLLSRVDEAYMSEASNYDTQLSALQSREIRCRELYSNLENFKEKVNTVKKINNILEEVNLFEKQTVRPLQFISNFDSVKETVNFYGCLEGDFVEMGFPCEDCGHSPHSDNHICPVFVMDKDLHTDSDFESVKNNPKRRERTESQDSFEIIDLMGGMNCEDSDKNSYQTEKDISSVNCSPKYEELSNVPECSKDSCVMLEAQPLHFGEKKLKENAKEKMHEVPLQVLLSKDCFLRSYEERIQHLTQQTLKNCSQKKNNGIYNRRSVTTDTKSWLQKPKNSVQSSVPVMDTESNSGRVNSKLNVARSPADLVKCAFAQFLTKDSSENWLSN